MKLLATILTLAPVPARKSKAAPDRRGFATYSTLGTITSAPWSGWTLHEFPQLDS